MVSVRTPKQHPLQWVSKANTRVGRAEDFEIMPGSSQMWYHWKGLEKCYQIDVIFMQIERAVVKLWDFKNYKFQSCFSQNLTVNL